VGYGSDGSTLRLCRADGVSAIDRASVIRMARNFERKFICAFLVPAFQWADLDLSLVLKERGSSVVHWMR
jgi:hypothetical protein